MLSPKAQVTLLRFLQDLEYRPLGGALVRNANVRIIAASNADLGTVAEAIDVNLFGPWRVIHALLPMLLACSMAMLVPTVLRNAPIYDSLRARTIHAGRRR